MRASWSGPSNGSRFITLWVHRIDALDLVVFSMADEDPIGEVEADAAVDEKDKQRSQQNKAMNAMTDAVRAMGHGGLWAERGQGRSIGHRALGDVSSLNHTGAVDVRMCNVHGLGRRCQRSSLTKRK